MKSLEHDRPEADLLLQEPSGPCHVAVVWQRFLPYHVARLRRLRERCKAYGHRLTAIEVASRDSSYAGFQDSDSHESGERLCCFPLMSYHELAAEEIHRSVLSTLNCLRPDIVFAPATPFPEGMAAYVYRMVSGTRAIMMDDAWELSDRRGRLVRIVKRLIHRSIDGVFIPAPSHAAYYESLGFDVERISYGVDAVDNDFFSEAADKARLKPAYWRTSHGLPEKYFLFVGRLLPRKGLATLISAYGRYRAHCSNPWALVLVGAGPDADGITGLLREVTGVHVIGPQFGEALGHVYGLAEVLIVPSISDPWALVLNEGLAAGLPVIASTGAGATRTLVHEGQNGWSVSPGDVDQLARTMVTATACSVETLSRMGRNSRQIISLWSLDRFVDGVFTAMRFPRSSKGGLFSRMAVRLWTGRVSVN